MEPTVRRGGEAASRSRGFCGLCPDARYYGRMPGSPRMVFLGFGKYARADRIYALEPITGEERGSGRRTLVWIEGIAEPLVASRTQETILEEMGEPTEQPRRRAGGRRAVVEHPQLFTEAEE